MFFSVKTKNWNWEILTKNFVTFKRWDGFKGMKNFSIMGVHWNIWFLKGFTKNQYIGEDCLKKWGLASLQIQEKVWGKIGGGCIFEGFW